MMHVLCFVSALLVSVGEVSGGRTRVIPGAAPVVRPSPFVRPAQNPTSSSRTAWHSPTAHAGPSAPLAGVAHVDGAHQRTSGSGSWRAPMTTGGREAFAGGALPAFRPADALPEGVTSLAAASGGASVVPYGTKDPQRRAWVPQARWRGEPHFKLPLAALADENRQWYHFDADGKVLKELAKHISWTLRGIDSPLYEPGSDTGAFVIVTNCDKVMVPGREYYTKMYFRNPSRKPGHMIAERMRDVLKRFPERVIMREVWEYMPKTKLSRTQFKNHLKLFAGPNHAYYEQFPVDYPMHRVMDATLTRNKPRSQRLKGALARHFSGRDDMLKQSRQDILDFKKRKKFVRFLQTYYDEIGEEAASKMSMDDFIEAAKNAAAQKTLDSSAPDARPQRPEPGYYLYTKIPKKKIINYDRPGAPMGRLAPR